MRRYDISCASDRATRRAAYPEEPIPRGDGGTDRGGEQHRHPPALAAHGRIVAERTRGQCPASALLPRRNLFRRLTKGTFGEGVALSSDKIFFQLGQHHIVRGQQPIAFAKSGRTAISYGKVAASCAITQQSRSCQMLLRSKPSHGTHWTLTLRSLGLDRELVRAPA